MTAAKAAGMSVWVVAEPGDDRAGFLRSGADFPVLGGAGGGASVAGRVAHDKALGLSRLRLPAGTGVCRRGRRYQGGEPATVMNTMPVPGCRG